MTVRLRHSAALARMLLVFFRRRVLRLGVLRSTPVRVFAVSASLLLLGTMCVSAYLFLEPLTGERAVWRVLFDTSTISLILWTQIAFLLVKVLFVNAEGMLRLSHQLPLTNRERAVAFLMYEATMTGVVAGVGLFSFAVSALVLLGPAALAPLTVSVVLPSLLVYLALSVLYQLLARLWSLIGLRRIGSVLSLLVLFVLLVLYSTRTDAMAAGLSRAYLDDRPYRIWATAPSWARDEFGTLPTIAAGLLAVAALTVLTLALTPNQHVQQSRYLKVPAPGWTRRVLGPYDWCLLRNSQTAVAAALAVALFLYLAVRSDSSPLWGFTVLSMGGLYQYTATEPLRALPGARVGAWRIYGRLVRAQLVLLALFVVPGAVVVLLADPGLWASSAGAVLGGLGGVVITTCVSVVFPAEKDNPLSVFLGLSTVAVVFALLALGLGMLNLPTWAVACSLVAAVVLFVWYAVQGIRASESRRRNEKSAPGRDRRRRVGPADPDDLGTGPAVPHVLDRR
ncbi:hypothetical protein JNUCC64_16180 [Streptomyces sp. JNUCC 64]